MKSKFSTCEPTPVPNGPGGYTTAADACPLRVDAGGGAVSVEEHPRSPNVRAPTLVKAASAVILIMRPVTECCRGVRILTGPRGPVKKNHAGRPKLGPRS